MVIILIIGAAFVSFLYYRYQSGPQKGSIPVSKKKQKTEKKDTSAIDSAIDYTTGHTSIKAYNRAKKKIDKVKKTKEKQMNEALSD